MKVQRASLWLTLCVACTLTFVNLAPAQDWSGDSFGGIRLFTPNVLNPTDDITTIQRFNRSFTEPENELIVFNDATTGSPFGPYLCNLLKPHAVAEDSAAGLLSKAGIPQPAVASFTYFPLLPGGGTTCDPKAVYKARQAGRAVGLYGFSEESDKIFLGKNTQLIEVFSLFPGSPPTGKFEPQGHDVDLARFQRNFLP